MAAGLLIVSATSTPARAVSFDGRIARTDDTPYGLTAKP